MKKALIITLFLIGIYPVFGQSLSDTIQIENFSGTSYYLNGKKLSPMDLHELFLTNNAALEEIITARNSNSTATILSISGGLLLGSYLVVRFVGQQSLYAAGIAGTGLILVSLPFFASYRSMPAGRLRYTTTK
ncbi:MAG: hypothetical protein IPH20_20965 [Bacteroidales bacterium]|nr:hypothetical protein [Bacteroidales bacterium]